MPDITLVDLRIQIRVFLALYSHAHHETERQCLDAKPDVSQDTHPHEMERKCVDVKANNSLVEYRMHFRFLSHCIVTLILRQSVPLMTSCW